MLFKKGDMVTFKTVEMFATEYELEISGGIRVPAYVSSDMVKRFCGKDATVIAAIPTKDNRYEQNLYLRFHDGTQQGCWVINELMVVDSVISPYMTD